MFRMVSPPIIRNSCHCIYSIWHYLDRYWHLSCPIQSRSRQVAVTASIMPDTVDTVIWAPDDGWRYHPKHVEQLFTPWCRVLLEKLTGLQVVKKFPAFHGTRRFITALTSVRHLSLSWASPIQSIYPPHLLQIHPNIIHPSTPRSPQWSLSLRLPHQEPIHPPLLNHTRHMPSSSHSSRIYHPHNIGWGVQII